MTYSIYVHQNKKNNKRYVGYSKNPKRRWQSQKSFAFLLGYHLYDQPFYRAIRRDGWDGFTHEIIEEIATKEETLNREVFYIALFRANRNRYGSEWGYNLTDGGEHPKFSDTTRKKMSDARMGRKDLVNSGSFQKGNKPWNTGKHHSEEVKDKMRGYKNKTWKLVDGKRIWMNKE